MPKPMEIEINPIELEKIIKQGLKKGRPSNCEEEMMSDGTISIMDNHIYFYVDVTPQTILKLNNSMVRIMKDNLGEAAQRDREPDPIHIHVNSLGGTVNDGFLAYDIIIRIKEKVPVFTHIEGNASSAATFITIAGTKRFITPLSNMLIHELRTWLYGTKSQISEEYQNMIKIQDQIEKIYLRHSKFELEELKKFLQRDTLLTAEEALERELVDAIETNIF